MFDWLQRDPGGFLLFMLYRVPAVLIALSFHELAHGYMALKSGDDTAQSMGRLTLNPLAHLDLFGTISMFLLGIGWAKPVPVNPNNFRRRRRDDLLVSAAGITVNAAFFILGTLLSIGIGFLLYEPQMLARLGMRQFLDFRSDLFQIQLFPQYAGELNVLVKTPWLLHVQRFVLQFAWVNLGLALFNLLPLPPLDGFHLLNDGLLGGRIRMDTQFLRVAQIGLIVLLMATDVVGKLISQAIYFVQGNVLHALLRLFGM